MAAQRVFATYAGRYGQRWLHAQLRREGHAVGRQRLCGWFSSCPHGAFFADLEEAWLELAEYLDHYFVIDRN